MDKIGHGYTSEYMAFIQLLNTDLCWMSRQELEKADQMLEGERKSFRQGGI